MCFAPQRRALFRHLNFQKWSVHGVFCTFGLRNMLRATTACTFSTSQLPKVVRQWCVLYILTSKCASRHKGVHFFMSHLASWLRTHRFSEPTFRPSRATNHLKNTVFRDFPTFSRICIFFLWLFLFSDFLSSTLLFSVPLPSSAFHLSILSEVWLLNFLQLLPANSHYYLLLLPANYYYLFLLITTYYIVFATSSYCLLLLTTTYSDLPLFTTTYYYLLLLSTACYYLLLVAATCYHLLLLTNYLLPLTTTSCDLHTTTYYYLLLLATTYYYPLVLSTNSNYYYYCYY